MDGLGTRRSRARSLLERKTEKKCCSLADFALEPYFPVVLFYNHRVSQSQSLSGPLANFLSGEEWFKDPGPDIFWDSRPCVANLNLHPFAVASRGNRNRTFASGASFHGVSDSVGRIDQQIQDDLIEFACQTDYGRQIVAKRRVNIGYIFPLIARDRDGGLNGAIDIDRALAFGWRGVSSPES
jgi:hypothetical protein